MSQLFIVLAGIYGATGVAFAAIAAHAGAASTLGSGSQMLLFHAPVLLALGLFARTAGTSGWAFTASGVLILLGAGLFAADLALRHYRGHALFPMAAPTGGSLMIAGWVALAVAGLLLRR